jgi:dienelactone hydrolase
MFHNDTGDRFTAAAAKAAWQETVSWFNRYLETG